MSIISFKFYDREKEINAIRKLKKPYFVIVVGRRRVGKTTFILESLKDENFIYFFVNPEMGEEFLLKNFEETIKEKIGLENYISLSTWEGLFKFLFENYRGVIVFDEFQWFKEINPPIPYILQKYLDLYSLKEKPSFIISGSIIGMMRDLFEKEGSPLFKRSHMNIHLKPFDLKTAFEILNDIGIREREEKMKMYLIFGGLPYYYKLMEKYSVKDTKAAIWNLVIDEFAPLQNEVEEILLESFRGRYSTYLKILYAIGTGHTKLSQISSFVPIPITSLPPYIKDLEYHLEIIKRHPLAFSNKHYYEIEDFFHIFWFLFIFKNKEKLAIDRERVYREILENLNTFYGITFEKFIRNLFKSLYGNKVRKYITKNPRTKEVIDIDVVICDDKAKTLQAIEIKWKDLSLRDAKKIIEELHEKLLYVEWHNEERKEVLGIFAKSIDKKAREWLESNGYKGWDLRDVEKVI